MTTPGSALGAITVRPVSRTLPPPPQTSFASDNAAGVSPEVMAALAAANLGSALAYGDDHWTRRAEVAIAELFEAPVISLACWGGTGANVVGLASVLRPWQAVIATNAAHIVTDECGAPARFSGATVAPVPHVNGKLEPEALAGYLDWFGTEHHPQPAVLSVSQATELGTIYTIEELAALADAAHRAGMLLHLDGARIANAVASSGSSMPEMVRDTGVDLMTFGFTKNGAMYGELVVYLRPELAADARFVRKQASQLTSKSRFVAAQVLALVEGGLWLRNADHANRMARRLAEGVGRIQGVEIAHPPEANAVFARIPQWAIPPLQEWSYFWEWDSSQSLVRWMTSFATTIADVDAFVAGVAAVIG